MEHTGVPDEAGSAPVATRLASIVGRALGVGFGALGRVRRGRPLHPRGIVLDATLTTWGCARPWRVPLLDRSGEARCLVRASRAAGLPAPLPDVQGVAVRLRWPDRPPADLLFATTGTGRLSRFVLLPRRSAQAEMTTLLPVRTPAGALLLRLSPEAASGGRRAWVVSAAPVRGPWEPFARLVTADRPLAPDADPPLRFDPVRNLPAGVEQYRWVRLARDPAYVLARRWAPPSTWRSRRPRA